MNLYKILVKHLAPKDNHTSIETYISAENEDKLYDLMCEFTCWNEESFTGIMRVIPERFLKYKDSFYEPDEITGECIDIQQEEILNAWKKYVISTKGEIGSDWADYDDLFYGKTHYGWELVKEDLQDDEFQILKQLQII